ncbi:hypothetical protein Vadar_019123 [Vaccinium darrowii]|uniref:Uncharacterized protein n=1 Tax=Vaccinium darrowii TaxID=229202 RepID=A0ACB7YFK7_9ERIC|nr:hypothetical protein Vadar_019123 [Vaccinium darrowii]
MNSKTIAMDTEVQTWQEKRKVFDKERENLENELANLLAWISEIEKMDDQTLKQYLQNRPNNLKTMAIDKSTLNKRVQKARKAKCSGIMSTVWKYNKEDGEDSSNSIMKNA